jgi:hypothetical protein
MENEGLPAFISIIVGVAVLGILVIAGILLHAFLTI